MAKVLLSHIWNKDKSVKTVSMKTIRATTATLNYLLRNQNDRTVRLCLTIESYSRRYCLHKRLPIARALNLIVLYIILWIIKPDKRVCSG